MKKLLSLALVTLGVTVSARAQWVVFDPTMNVQSILNTAQEIAKYVTMIENQVQQIQTLTDQINEFKHFEDLFGNPGSVALATAQPLINDLKKTELGQTLTTLETTVNAGQAMIYNGEGLFQSIGTTFTTPGGRKITRQQTPFLPVAAIQKTTENYLSVASDATARRVALKYQIAATTEQLKAATTDAEVQKLQGVLLGLSAALNNTDYEINQATTAALVQDIANRNAAQRQIEAQSSSRTPSLRRRCSITITHLGHEFYNEDSLATADGVSGGVLVSEGLHYAAKTQAEKAYANGYDKGKSDAVKQYWLYVSMQKQRNQASNVRLYPSQLSERPIDGMTYLLSTKLLRIEEQRGCRRQIATIASIVNRHVSAFHF